MTYTLRDNETGAEVDLSGDEMDRLLYALDLAEDDYAESAKMWERETIDHESPALWKAAEKYGDLWRKIQVLTPDQSPAPAEEETKRPVKTAYVIVPVDLYEDGTMEIDFNDSGEPGPWGNVYVYEYDGPDVDGDWDFDYDAVARGWDLVHDALAATDTRR